MLFSVFLYRITVLIQENESFTKEVPKLKSQLETLEQVREKQ